MTYPRMNKDDYPTLPAAITNESDYQLVLEFVVYLATQIEKLQEKKINPILDEEEKVEEQIKNKRIVDLTMKRYDELCNMIDEWREKGG